MLIPLSQADERCGAKAANLARLLREDFRVPAGFVIEDTGDDAWVHELGSALHGLGSGPFAVRSSALGEDGVQASFAGQLHTTLGVTTEAQVAGAVRRTALSGAGERAAAYAARTRRSPVSAVPRPRAGSLSLPSPAAAAGR
ncbi:PEP/pyruvate-binding domain-containing protein [Streptomyces qinglanensis]|uniref:PEP/pyruvate-binding domain-containing protein n=1 Tax=Streptomyces qinglanensis TaxID=943816 RepID=UPI003D7538B8